MYSSYFFEPIHLSYQKISGMILTKSKKDFHCRYFLIVKGEKQKQPDSRCEYKSY